MGKGFKDVNIAFAGTHEHSEKIPQWVKANGGIYSRDVTELVTHLVATEAAFTKNVQAVQKAKKLNIRIVTYDWLEDSLMSKTPAPKCVGPYLWERVLKDKRKRQPAKMSSLKNVRQKKQRGVDPEKTLGEFRKGARAIISDMEDLGYHLYVDKDTGVAYTATLVRSSVVNSHFHKETFLARVYETNKSPHTYSAFVKYSRTGASGKDILAPGGSTLDLAVSTFEKFFKTKTGLEWKDRFDDSRGWFTFERPTGILGSLRIDAQSKITDSVAREHMSMANNDSAEGPGLMLEKRTAGSANSPLN
ncbi:BRCT domain protein [Talaromyces proteolyticus]|uniref:BRCT domain protein n=1 Tax=Talaromyces proteolyticus TaxID=1131652 RepID=A0AAD4KWJ9_9EURO|nr:BRCT domain protein [Talaromyces proteolyticus]KAH8698493.1 BRCT domain protein [Talaromyces proteolyticus]